MEGGKAKIIRKPRKEKTNKPTSKIDQKRTGENRINEPTKESRPLLGHA